MEYTYETISNVLSKTITLSLIILKTLAYIISNTFHNHINPVNIHLFYSFTFKYRNEMIN